MDITSLPGGPVSNCIDLSSGKWAHRESTPEDVYQLLMGKGSPQFKKYACREPLGGGCGFGL